MGVQAEVKKFLRDPNRGRPKPQLFETAHTEDDEIEVVERERSYIEMERHGEDGEDGTSGEVRGMRRRGRRLQEEEEEGKCVDVVLSDMSAPWEQTTGFWKRSLSDPYIRMMNTSGINFKDHAGSMVSIHIRLLIMEFGIDYRFRTSAQLRSSLRKKRYDQADILCVSSIKEQRTSSWRRN